MIVFRDLAEVPTDFGPSAVAIGKFDGVHAGHRAIIERLNADAKAAGLRSVVVTFDRNPLAVLRPEICPPRVISNAEKLRQLAALGVDATLMLRFDEALAAVPAEVFVRTHIVDALAAEVVLVGNDFRFGQGGRGDPALLRTLGAELGFSVDVVDDVILPGDDRRVSSSWVREMLQAGDVQGASRVLGRPVRVSGEVVHGHKRGREMGFPTANLPDTGDAIVPADGIYAGWLEDLATGERMPAAISVGTNPTFDDVHIRHVEAHVLDREWLDLYGRDVAVEFTQRLRGMVAFDDVAALKEQIAADVRAARELLRDFPATSAH